MANAPDVEGFFHESTNTAAFLVIDPESRQAAVIDPPLDYDAVSGQLGTAFVDQILDRAESLGAQVVWAIDTHVHADHLSAVDHVRKRTGARVGIGAGIQVVRQTFGSVFGEDPDADPATVGFDQLFEDGDTEPLGGLVIRAIATPGHTPACMTYVIGDAAFVGDTLFMPDFGTARCDFPKGDARTLWRSVHRILDLPPETRVFVGHDYAPGGREFAWQTSVAEEKANNKHVKDGTTEDTFVTMRTTRDAELGLPALIVPSIQVNIRTGRLPDPDSKGVVRLTVPINAFPGT